MLVVARLRSPEVHGADGGEAEFLAGVRDALTAFAARPGHLASRLCRALDDPTLWVLVSEWQNVGSYRRALSSYDVRMASGRLMGAVINEPTAYEDVNLSSAEQGSADTA